MSRLQSKSIPRNRIENTMILKRPLTAGRSIAVALLLLIGTAPVVAQLPETPHRNLQDVGVTGSSSEDASGRITDTLTVFNHSGVGWYAPEVKATLPSGVRFVVVDRKTDTCTAVGQLVTCRVGTLRAMQSVDIKVVMQATDPHVPVNRSYTVYPLDTDAHPDNNTVTLTTTGSSAENTQASTHAPKAH